MNNNEKIREKIRERFLEYTKNGLIKVRHITGPMGVEFDKNGEFFLEARYAAQKNKEKVDSKNIRWVPISWENEIILVCGIENNDILVTAQRKLLKGLVEEISFDEFLGLQIKKPLDQKSTYVRELLETNNIQTMEEAIDRGDILGLNLRIPQAVILFKIPGFLKTPQNKTNKREAAADINSECSLFLDKLASSFGNYEKNIFVCLTKDTFACLKWVDREQSEKNQVNHFKLRAKHLQETVFKITGTKPTIGIGQYYPGLKGLRKSYSDAKVALNLGEKIWEEQEVYHIQDIGMYVSLSPDLPFERKCELAYQILGKILPDESLYKTVTVFLECDMNLSESAKKLHLHRNTLIYRLNKIKTMIGLDPKKFSDAVQIKLGFLLYGPSIRCKEEGS